MNKLILVLISLFITANLFAQSVGINATGTIPDGSAMLDVSSTSKGFLPPRMTYVQRQAIATPSTGLLVFCIDCGSPTIGGELQIYSGGQWRNLTGSAASSAYPILAQTAVASSITFNSASSGGNVTSDRGVAITARGVCWSTSPNPTIADSKTTDAGTTGTYTSSLTGLTGGTTYYVRAYATSSAGTGYGEQIYFTTTGIGSSYGSGIVFYILQPGDPGYIAGETHGLIAAASDQSTGIVWSKNNTTIIGTTSTALGTGLANTNAIVAQSGSGTCASSICKAYNGGGKSDWYLPSLNELNLMYNNIGQGAASPYTNIGGFADFVYWSSSEANSLEAWYQSFVTSVSIYSGKQSTLPVRAVRSF